MTDKLKDMLESRQAPGAIIKGNVCYASPLDGKPITTHRARAYDLESNGCVDHREGKEMAADARRYHNSEPVTVDAVRRAAGELGYL